MDILSIDELRYLTREALCDLSTRIEFSLRDHDTGSIGRMAALATLANIRRVMLLRGFTF
jgi:hypothetical protein